MNRAHDEEESSFSSEEIAFDDVDALVSGVVVWSSRDILFWKTTTHVVQTRARERVRKKERVRNANNNNEPKETHVVEDNERDEDDAPFRDESAGVVRRERHFWIYSEERYFGGGASKVSENGYKTMMIRVKEREKKKTR